jgi:hypothetical protein
MATAGGKYSLDHHPLEHVKFSGIEQGNLVDLVSIVVGLKSKYGIVPHAAAAEGYPIRNTLTVSYMMESITLSKVYQHPVRHPASARPRHHLLRYPQYRQFDVDITLGG